MPNAPSLSPSASRSWFHSRSRFRVALSLRLWLRAIWLAVGLLYFWADLTAELEMHKTIDGRLKPAAQLVSEANWAVNRFPFDPNLRQMRRWVEWEIVKKEKANAAGQ